MSGNEVAIAGGESLPGGEDDDEEQEDEDEDDADLMDYEKEGNEEEEDGEGEEGGDLEGLDDEEEVQNASSYTQQGGAMSSAAQGLPPGLAQSSTAMDYREITRDYEGGGGEGPFHPGYDDIMRLTSRGKRRRGRGRGRGREDSSDVPKGPKKKKKGVTGGRVMPESLKRVYGEAQRYYMLGQYKEALDLLGSIIKVAANVPDPYQLMGQIYEDQRNIKKAAEVSLVGCQFGPKDPAQWKKTGHLFLELGPSEYHKAQYCFGRAIKLNKKDIEAIGDRALVFSLWGRVEKAVLGYEHILRLSPPNPETWLSRLAEDCFRQPKFWDKGLLAVSEVLCRTLGTAFVSRHIKWLPLKKKAEPFLPSKDMEVAYEATSMLCRHLMNAPLRQFEHAAGVIQACHIFIAKLRERQTRFQDEGEVQLALPLDLVVRFGICQLYLQQLHHALQCFNALKQRDAAEEAVAPLLEDVACAFMDTGRHFRALDMLRRLDADSDVLTKPTIIRVKLRMARSYLALTQLKQAATALEQVQKLCDEAEGTYVQAEREATVLMATTLRGLRDKEGMARSLDAITSMVMQTLDEPLPEALINPPRRVTRRRDSFFRNVVSGASGGPSQGSGGGASSSSAPSTTVTSTRPFDDDDDNPELAMASGPEALKLEMCLEYGLLCKELDRRQDFVSCVLSLLELVIYQSKLDFRRAAKKRLAELASWTRPDMGEDDTGEQAHEELKVQEGKDRTIIHELMARAWPLTPMQRDLENLIKGGFRNREILPLLGEVKVFQGAYAVVQSCIESSMLSEATNICRALVKRKKLLNEAHGKQLHDLVMAHAVQEDDYTCAVRAALVNVMTEPHSIYLCNSLNRIVRKSTHADVNRAIIRRLNKNTPDSVALSLLAGNAFSISRNYQMALDRYLSAYRLSPDDPIISLSIAVLLTRVLTHRKMVDRHGCLVKALAFLERYVDLRRKHGLEVLAEEDGGVSHEAFTLVVEQEVNYNVGRAFHQAGLAHMALQHYRKALSLYDENEDVFKALDAKAHLTTMAAYNLSCIYRSSGNVDLERTVVDTYLTL